MGLKNAWFRKRKKKESLAKYVMGLLHLWLGLLSSIVIIIVCLTGSIYAFKNQVLEWSNRDKVFVKVQSQVLPISYFEEKLSEENRQITSIVLSAKTNRSHIIASTDLNGQNPTAHFYNPYTGENLGAASAKTDQFFNTVEALHKNLLMGEIGKQIVGIFVLIFILLLISGLVLWWPKAKKKQVKEAFTIRWKAKFHRLNYDLHNTLGFYSLLLLLFMAITGVYITYPWVKNAVLMGLGGPSLKEQTRIDQEADDDAFDLLMSEMLSKEDEKSELKEVDLISLDEIYAKAQAVLPYKGSTTIQMPNEQNPRYSIQKLNTDNWLGAILPDFIDFDKNGELKKTELFKNKPLYQQFKEISKPLHTGEILGLKSIIFYAIISFIGFSLPITGFIYWWKRAKKKILS